MSAVFRIERWSRVNVCGGCEQSLDLSVQVWDTAMVRSGWEIPQARDFWGVLRILNLKLASQIVIKVYFSRQESHVEYTKQFISLTYNFRKSRLTVGGLPIVLDFPDSSVGKESSCNAGDPDSLPGLGRSARSGEGVGYPLQYSWASLVAQLVKNLPAMQQTWVWSLDWEDPLEKGKAAHSSILAWRIPWTVESMGCRVRHNWVTFTFTFQLYSWPGPSKLGTNFPLSAKWGQYQWGCKIK